MTTPYTLEYYGKGTTPTDITEFVNDIEKFTDVGTGEVVSARLMLDARFGDFVTEDNNGATPIIKQYDLFRLEIRDDDGNSYSRFLFQDDVSPQKNNQGNFLTLDLFGREAYLQKMYFPGHFYFISFRDMIQTIVNFYNENKGTDQPRITPPTATSLSNIPSHAFGVFEFGEKTTVYDALMDVVTRLALPVASGGDGRRWGMVFADTPARSLMIIRIGPRGLRPTVRPILPKAITISETKETLKGNIIVVKGKPGSGSYPEEVALWRSLAEEYENIPPWDAETIYRPFTYVRYQDKIYRSTIAFTNANVLPTQTGWQEVSFELYVIAQTGNPNFVYSPWTKGRAINWKNRGGNAGASGSANSNASQSFFAQNTPSGRTQFDALCFSDHNLVIRDRNAWRDWVDFRVLSREDIPTPYLYDPTTNSTTIDSRTYHGMRVLVDPKFATNREIGEPFDVPDKFGNSFENAMAMQDRDGDWIVIRNARQFDECAVLAEGKVYDFNAPPGDRNGKAIRHLAKTQSNLSWWDGSKYALGNDCFHYPTVLENVDGLIGENDQSIISLDQPLNGGRFTDNSGIKIQYSFTESSQVSNLIISGVLNAATGGLYGAIRLFNSNNQLKNFTSAQVNLLYGIALYNIGLWCPLWEAPDPKSGYHGTGDPVGSLFGGDADNKRPVLDFLNLNQTPSGRTGYGHADSNQLGEIDGIKFLLNFNIEGITTDIFRGDFPVRCFIYDLLGNVWVSDATYRFLGFSEEMSFPLSTFRVYRARIQPAYTIGNFISRAIDPELKITEIFERRLVKRIGFQFMFAYDDDGRYNFDTWETLLRRLTSLAPDTVINYTATIDAFHFTKAPVAVARDTTDPENSINERHVMRELIEYNEITNVAQLQKIANSQLDRSLFQEDFFTVKIDDYVAVSAEDSVYFQDADFIPESLAGNDNTRRLVVRKVNYSIGDKSTTSGIVSTIDLYRPRGGGE